MIVDASATSTEIPAKSAKLDVYVSSDWPAEFRFLFLSRTVYICGPADPEQRSKLEPLLSWAKSVPKGYTKDNQGNLTGVRGMS